MLKENTNWLQQIDLALLGPQYDITKPVTFQIGNRYGLDPSKVVKGIRIPNQNELNAVASTQNGAVLMTNTQLSRVCLSLFDFKRDEICSVHLPAMATVIDGATEPHAGAYYEIGYPVDWSKSEVTIVEGIAIPGAGQFYMLSIQVYFQS